MKPLLIDVMLDGRYVGQLKYDGNYHLENIDGKVLQCISEKDAREFVESKYTWLSGKDFKVEFTTQRVKL